MPIYLSPTYRVVNTINGTLSSGLADSLSNIYVAGSYGSSSAIMNQPSGPSSYSFPATLGGTAGSLIKLSQYGTVLYRTYVDGTGTDYDSFVNLDSTGNVYITGTHGGQFANVYYSNTSNVSNIISSPTIYFPTTNEVSGFVVKTLSNGFPLWRTYVCPNLSAISPAAVASTYLTTDSNSNVYMCGSLIAPLGTSFGPAYIYYSNVSNVANIIQSSIQFSGFTQGINGFFMRMDSTGKVVGNGGIYTSPLNANAFSNSIVVDTQSNIYLTGTFDSRGGQYITSNLSVSSGSLPSFTASSNSAAYIVSYYGNCQYISQSCVSNSSSTVYATGIGSSIDSSSNLYMCGSASSFCTFYGTNTSLVTPSTVQNTAGYVLKCSPSFAFYFRMYVDGPGYEVCTSVATDPLYSNIFIGGTYGSSSATAYGASSGTLTLPATSGNQGGYIIRYDNTGTPIWQVTLSGASAVNINSVTVDSSQTSYITGSYGPGAVTLYDTLNSNTILPAQASSTGFSLKLDVNGAIVFTGFTGLGTLSGTITSVIATTTTIAVLFSTTNTNTDDTVTIYQASTLNGTPIAFGATPVLASSGTITCSPTNGYYIFLVITSTLGGTYKSSAWGTAVVYVSFAITTAGLVSNYDFTSTSTQATATSTTVNDLQGNNNLTWNSAPTAFDMTGIGGAKVGITMNGNYASKTSVSYNLSTGFTAEVLFKLTSLPGGYPSLFTLFTGPSVITTSQTNGFQMYGCTPSNYLYNPYMQGGTASFAGPFWWNGSGPVAANSLTTGVFYHLVFTVSPGGAIVYYLNGGGSSGWAGSSGSQNVAFTTGAQTGYIGIGQCGNATSTIIGTIAQVRYYNAALTTAQVQNNYNYIKSLGIFQGIN